MGLPRWSSFQAGSSPRLKLPRQGGRNRNILDFSTGALGIWEDYRGYKFITDHHSLILATHLSIQGKKWTCCNKKINVYNSKVKQEPKKSRIIRNLFCSKTVIDIMYKSVIIIYNTNTEDMYGYCIANNAFFLQQWWRLLWLFSVFGIYRNISFIQSPIV